MAVVGDHDVTPTSYDNPLSCRGFNIVEVEEVVRHFGEGSQKIKKSLV